MLSGKGVIFESNTLASLNSGGCVKFELLLVFVTSVSSLPSLWSQCFLAVKESNRSKL